MRQRNPERMGRVLGWVLRTMSDPEPESTNEEFELWLDRQGFDNVERLFDDGHWNPKVTAKHPRVREWLKKNLQAQRLREWLQENRQAQGSRESSLDPKCRHQHEAHGYRERSGCECMDRLAIAPSAINDAHGCIVEVAQSAAGAAHGLSEGFRARASERCAWPARKLD